MADIGRPPVVIAGSGFAGIVAACDLADRGVPVTLLDENVHVGGQLLRRPPAEWGGSRAHADPVKRQGFRFVAGVRGRRIEVLNRTRILAVYPGNEILVEEEGKPARTLRPRHLLLATGARERFLPFPGWTLPGVVSAGAVQVLLKSHGLLPAGEVLVAGSGLFLMAAAAECLRHGMKVRAVLEATPLGDKLPLLAQLPFQPAKLAEGLRIMARLAASGVPLRHSTRIREARGDGRIEEAVTVRVDGRGCAVPGSEQAIPARFLATGYGFAPNTELAQLAGCELEHRADLGGWIVRVNERLETSIPGICAAGEITGVAGALKSATEGHLAALAILEELGEVKTGEAGPRWNRLQARRRRHLRFGHFFNHLYRIPAAAWAEIPDDTIACRCEDVTIGELRQAVDEGYDSHAALKVPVRAGMGDCQGRTCGPMVTALLETLTGRDGAEIPPPVVRPPVKPARIGSLADHDS